MKKKFYFILPLLLGSFLYLILSSYSGGITGRSTIGCGGGGCHGSAVSANTVILLSGLPTGGYTNGTVYSITLSVTNTIITGPNLRDGFDMTSTGGSFTAIAGTALNGATEIRHSTPKTVVSGTASWTFNWTAPISGSATINFNVAGMATNGDGSPSSIDKYNIFSTSVIKAPSPYSVTATSTTILCNGGFSTITATSINGSAPFEYKLNTGSFQSISSFPNQLAGTYTVTSKDATTATRTTVITVNQPTAITFNPPSNSSPVCAGGVGTSSIIANGGTGTKTYSISPLGPQTNTTGNFIGLTAQAYTITATDINLCSSSTVITISQPTSIIFNSPLVTQPICFGGTGSAITIATGGTGGKTYTINPLGPQTNTTGNFSGLTAQLYLVTATDAVGCSGFSSFSVIDPAPITVTSNNVSGCQGSPIALSGTPAGGSFSVANPYTGPSTTYTYSYTNGFGCTGISTPSAITTNPVSSTTIVMPSSTSLCQVYNHISGNHFYANSSCELIATINSSSLGSTSSCISFLPGTPSWNGEPYANRVYSITPTTQPLASATMCLYYTPADLIAAGISTNADISITKIGGAGVLGGSGSVLEILNSNMIINNLTGGIKEVCFPVTSFSSFYLHSKNLNNIPLALQLIDFNGSIIGSKNVLSWETKQEINHDYFNIQFSEDGIDFKTIAKVISQSNDENYNTNLFYKYYHENPSSGYNFYRLEQVDADGKSTYSEHVVLYRNYEQNTIHVYPNPTSGEFTVTSIVPTNIVITDINGKIVFKKSKVTSTQALIQKQGLYFVQFTSMSGEQLVRKLIVN